MENQKYFNTKLSSKEKKGKEIQNGAVRFNVIKIHATLCHTVQSFWDFRGTETVLII